MEHFFNFGLKGRLEFMHSHTHTHVLNQISASAGTSKVEHLLHACVKGDSALGGILSLCSHKSQLQIPISFLSYFDSLQITKSLVQNGAFTVRKRAAYKGQLCLAEN